MRKMLLAMVSDIRVVLIKLALRTRTLQFLGSVPDSPQKTAIAKETFDIFGATCQSFGGVAIKMAVGGFGLSSSKARGISPYCSIIR